MLSRLNSEIFDREHSSNMICRFPDRPKQFIRFSFASTRFRMLEYKIHVLKQV
jgi:hypothetical protein